MIYYIYRIKNIKTGQYYIGQRKCNEYEYCHEDPYMGSGDWIKEQCNKKYGSVYRKELPDYFVKELIEYCGSKEELNYREEIIIGDLWETDDLCMNKTFGGSVCLNPYRDTTIYHWKHVDGKEEFLTQNDMVKKYSLCKVGVSSAVNKRVGHVNGWFIYEDVYNDKIKALNDCNIQKRDTTIYHWKHVDGKEEFLTRYDFYNKYIDCPSNRVSDVINRKNRQVNGWYLYEDLIKKKKYAAQDETTYHWKHVDGREEFLTRVDMKRKHISLTDSGMNLLVKCKIKSHRGWKLER